MFVEIYVFCFRAVLFIAWLVWTWYCLHYFIMGPTQKSEKPTGNQAEKEE